MPIKCENRERIFFDGSAQDWAGLELHAVSCPECARELQAWKALGVAAEELRDYQATPALWPRIESALAQQAKQSASHKFWLEWPSLWRNVPMIWQTALSGALVLLMALTAGYVVWHRHSGPPVDAHNPLLRDSKVAEVERAERDYMKAIDKLAGEAKPQLDTPDSPLMANYREKLMMLDGAIDELRMHAGQNPSNAHLRYQLLSMYQEKQATLQEVLETKP